MIHGTQAEPQGDSAADVTAEAVIAAQIEELIQLRHELHRTPEIGLRLPHTQERMLREFRFLGLEITQAREVSGFAAVLRGGLRDESGSRPPVVLLRADMDALPIAEETGLDWASDNGAMHGCGHDVHMAGIVGAARALVAVREHLLGDVVFLLQPGEEGWDGAQHLIDEGLLEAAGRLPDHAYGLHVWSALYPTGRITARPGPLMASSDTFSVTVRGRGGHGSAPHLAMDPVPIAAEIVTQSHVMVTREFDVFDPVVLTCGSITAGQTANVIPEEATAAFTLRAFSAASRERLMRGLERLCRGICAAHGTSCEIDAASLYPVTVNDPDETAYVQRLVEEHMPGRWSELEHPVGGAEDFSKILERVPGAFVFVSAVPDGVDPTAAAYNHSSHAVYDDRVVPDCSRLLAHLSLGRLTAETGRNDTITPTEENA